METAHLHVWMTEQMKPDHKATKNKKRDNQSEQQKLADFWRETEYIFNMTGNIKRSSDRSARTSKLLKSLRIQSKSLNMS